MKQSTSRLPGSGLAALAGGILFAIVTLFHPVLTNPWAGGHGLNEVARSNTWMWDHSLMVVAMTLWLVGLAGGEAWFRKEGAAPRNAARLFIAALAMWLLILAVELGVIPPIVRALAKGNDTALRVVGEVMFTFGLLGGYFAMVLVWLGVALLGWSMTQEAGFTWFPTWGFISGATGIAGIALSLWKPAFALIVLVLTSIPPYLWTLFLAWKMLRGAWI